MNQQQIVLGNHSPEELEHIMKTAAEMDDAGERIQFLSGQFLGTGYAESTLIGDPNTREILVINLQGVDCLTFIEYMEAMRLSFSFPEFIANLKRVRYKSGVVDYYARNHFFTDWKEFNADFVEDVTESVAGGRIKKIHKKLNEKDDGAFFLQGIQPVMREISYIPSKDIGQEVIGNLGAGDYVGIFSDLQGLDFSHTGIIVRHNDIVYFRHASSQPSYRRVVDQDFREYIVRKPGIVVFRPKT
jgi:N-acetylmuramoyl-L-alanine amidase-like